MPTAFLTGGTGFLGGHAARALCAQGWRVRFLTRDPARTIDGLTLDVVTGDLSDEARLARAVEGVDAVVHVAGLVKARTLEDYREVNVRGTRRLLAAASRTAPGALWVQVSSVAAAGPALQGRPVAENEPSRPVSWYGISKREGELAVAEVWKGSWIVLRPAVVFGPGDRGLLPYFRMAAAGWMPVPAGQNRIQLIGAERAALALARAAARPDLTGRVGYLCDALPVRLSELAREIASLPRRRPRVFGVPNAVVRLLGAAETLRETVTGHSRPFNADKAREVLAGDWLCDGAPVERDLGLPPAPPLAEGLRALWDWYRAAGWIPRAGL